MKLNFQTAETERLSRQIHSLTEIAKTLTSPLDLPELLNAVMEKIVGVLEQADVGVIMLWDQSSALFRASASFGFDKDSIRQMGLRAGESVTGKVFDEGVARLICSPTEVQQMMSDMREANRNLMALSTGTDKLPSCTIAAPLSVGEQKFGVLVLETLREQGQFTEDDLPFLQSIADLVALAIDRSRLEAKADAVREARQEDRLRSEIMATLSHQLRMPLASIKGYATALMLEEIQWKPEKQQEFLGLIEEECDNMATMIKELLDSALIDVGQLILERQPVHIQHLATEIAAEFQQRFTKHTLITDIPSNFPYVSGDSRWLKQVFRNIIDNSIKYSPEGGLVVMRGEIRPAQVVISVSDQGIGISPEDLIPLFERYFRSKNSEGIHVSGTGLGLPIARSIIEAHGGRIWVESKVGQGTSIYFSLPRVPSQFTEEEP
jgi:K+-sensing histidine kinase KdpD